MYQLRQQGSVTVVAPQVAINQGSVDQLRAAVEPRLADRPTFLVFDLSAVPLLDSSALEWILDTQDEALRYGGELKLASPNSLCSDILGLTGVDERVAVHSDTVTAVGSFSR
ncbi:MAG: STAS domain-containing protein [Pirellulaceae bacterium]|nr:STAS domain-containing protein [Planctomycetales bacterium]